MRSIRSHPRRQPSGTVELSRTISHALRHEPWLYELELDDEGWTSVEELLRALRTDRPQWATITEADLAAMLARADKKRHELRNGRIRALYGHSVAGRLLKERAVPPEVLYHGTAHECGPAISVEGLRPMRRQYVHLSVDIETAEQVGKRKGTQPIILLVRAREAHEQGIAFYRGNEFVWLADAVPAAYIDAT